MRGSHRTRRAIGAAVFVAFVVVAAVCLSARIGFVRTGGGVLPSVSAPVSVSASAAPVRDPAGPRFPIVTRSSASIDGVDARVYLPLPGSARRGPERYPLVVFVPAPGADPDQYEQVAHDLGGYGLAVVVLSRGSPSSVSQVRAWAVAVNAGPPAPAQGLVDPSTMFVVSDGAGAEELREPRQVRAVAIYSPGSRGALRVGALPIVVVCGSRDPAVDGCTSESVTAVVIDGAGPLSITDQGRRTARTAGAPGSDREATIATFAQWTALWLLASVGDPEAKTFYERAATSPPQGVEVRLASG